MGEHRLEEDAPACEILVDGERYLERIEDDGGADSGAAPHDLSFEPDIEGLPELGDDLGTCVGVEVFGVEEDTVEVEDYGKGGSVGGHRAVLTHPRVRARLDPTVSMPGSMPRSRTHRTLRSGSRETSPETELDGRAARWSSAAVVGLERRQEADSPFSIHRTRMTRHPPRHTSHRLNPRTPANATPPAQRTHQPVQSEWRIDSLVPGGEGLARLSDGRIGFAGKVAIGDRIVVGSLDEHKGWVRAEAWTLVEPGPGRIEPPCSWYGECGGCDWMHLSSSAQLQGKADIIVGALRRIGGISTSPPRVFAGPRGHRYRRRLRLHIDPEGRVGLLARASHRVVEVGDCLVAREELVLELRSLREWAASRRRVLGEFDAVELRVAETPPQMGLCWHARSDRVSAAALAAVRELASDRRAVAVSGHGVPVSQFWRDTMGVEIEVPLGSFVQVYAEVNAAMTDALVSLCQEHGVTTFLELYCGAGNLTLPLLAHGLRGHAIELDSAAVHAAKRAAKRQGLPVDIFSCGDAGSPSRRSEAAVDLVLLDPPRTGAASAVQHVSRLRPNHVALCACDPATLARDLRNLAELGYRVEHLAAFDMFPQTHHVEALVWLTLGKK